MENNATGKFGTQLRSCWYWGIYNQDGAEDSKEEKTFEDTSYEALESSQLPSKTEKQLNSLRKDMEVVKFSIHMMLVKGK